LILSTRYDAAMAFALEKHRAQVRKESNVPYATHLISVSALVGEFGGDEEQMIAGLLHDVIEDQDVQPAELEQRFGARVARIVVGCTDSVATPKPPWKQRKENYLKALATKHPDIKLVSACDKLHNATAIARDLCDPQVGPNVWGRFTAEKEQVRWYYRSLVEALRHDWRHRVVTELDGVVAFLEAD
jgi:(p)ppGpp synthase/HD superfamily hydrolase